MRGSIWMTLALAGCTAAQGIGDEPDRVVDPLERGDADVVVLAPEDVRLELGTREGGFPSQIPARIHAPATTEDGPAPVVILNHGFAVDIDEYFDTGNHLASWGFVVVVPQWDSGIGGRTHVGLKDDVIAAMDAIQDDGFPADLDGITIDTSVFGVAGHSRGGKQAIFAALEDDRIVAVAGIDPVDSAPPFGGSDAEAYPSLTPERVGALEADVVLIGMGRGSEGEPACAPAGEGYGAYYATMPSGATLFELPTAGHQDVLDTCAAGSAGGLCGICPAGEEPAKSQRIVHATLAAFFGERMRDGLDFSDWLEGNAVADVLEDATRVVKD